ncbi:MAG: hypothetical protein EOO15_23465 [Chitinophagaceae bacterium]|nr:MAG: hypothetical protein EOO15_23465 [Chitinophagaceae bacterium]
MLKFLTLPVLAACTLAASAQRPGRDVASISQPIQVDSSHDYLVGTFPDKTNRMQINLSGNSPLLSTMGWTNLYLYNTRSHKSQKVFSEGPLLVYPIVNPYNSQPVYSPYESIASGMSTDFLLIVAKSDSYAKDGFVDDDDPNVLYLVSKAKWQVSRLTPPNANVVSWTLSKDRYTLLVKMQQDQNGDKKFSDEEVLLNQADLLLAQNQISLMPVLLK